MEFQEYCKAIGLERTADKQASIGRKNDVFMNLTDYEKDTIISTPSPKLNDPYSAMKFYDANAPVYDHSFLHQLDETGLIGLQVSKRLHESERVLELYCGTGTLGNFVASMNPKKYFVGLDISRNMIKQAQRKRSAIGIDNVDFVVASSGYLPFRDSSFDSIYESRVKDFTKSDKSEGVRVCVSGGKVMGASVSERSNIKGEFLDADNNGPVKRGFRQNGYTGKTAYVMSSDKHSKNVVLLVEMTKK